VLLLCETDHQALLKAGREILRKMPKDRLNPQPDGTIKGGRFCVPNGVQIPRAIQNLKCGCFINYDGYLSLVKNGGRGRMDYFGINIYPEDYKEPEDNFKYGDRKLTAGLWYYDDGYLNNPEYDKRIDELIKKHKK
jgi:hypothetical protein